MDDLGNHRSDRRVNENQMPRRRFLKIGGDALAVISVFVVSGRAIATTNPSVRNSLKYQGTPEGEKSCANCMQFVPGTSAKDLGSCKIIPGDTEISPQGYCIAWAKKA
jgi:hypothetical protein